MADSKECDQGAMIAGMALRVKYRKLDSEGQIVRKKIAIQHSGVHPKNRGGVYASGLRVKNLAIETMEAGFVKDEVDSGGVVVEETPYEFREQRGKNYMTGKTYNKIESQKDELLKTCFEEPYADVHYMLLAHNTIMLVCRAWITKAKWDIPVNQKRTLTYCDEKRRLSLAAVAEHDNGKQLVLACDEGFMAEVLSWKMDVEDPKAASVISNALNTSHQLALRTTELTAVAVLRGEIIVQSKNISQKVLFKSVVDNVRRELSVAADDPELIEVFDYLISLGVGTNSYVEELEEFAIFFVNSKFRQLRFSAFGSANKVPENCPLVKLALIKRAFRKKPANGYCPSPEQDWGKYEPLHVRDLEALLRFFHGNCMSVLDEMTPQSRSKMLANIDLACTEAFYAAKLKKSARDDIRRSMLVTSAKYATELGVSEKNT